MSLVASYILMILAILAAIFTLESKRLIFSVLGLIAMNFFVWGVLLSYGELLIAWIQLIVYGGGFTAMFIVVVALTEKQRDETSFNLVRTILTLWARADRLSFSKNYSIAGCSCSNSSWINLCCNSN